MNKLLTLEGLADKVENIIADLEQAEVNYLQHASENARYTADYSRVKGVYGMQASGKNAQERQAFVDINTAKEQEDHLVWSSILRADDHRIRSLQAQLGVLRSLISAVDRQPKPNQEEPKGDPRPLMDVISEMFTEAEANLLGQNNKPLDDLPF